MKVLLKEIHEMEITLEMKVIELKEINNKQMKGNVQKKLQPLRENETTTI
jgi:hypothetical protein